MNSGSTTHAEELIALARDSKTLALGELLEAYTNYLKLLVRIAWLSRGDGVPATGSDRKRGGYRNSLRSCKDLALIDGTPHDGLE